VGRFPLHGLDLVEQRGSLCDECWPPRIHRSSLPRAGARGWVHDSPLDPQLRAGAALMVAGFGLTKERPSDGDLVR
jgi:hypothetical protein